MERTFHRSCPSSFFRGVFISIAKDCRVFRSFNNGSSKLLHCALNCVVACLSFSFFLFSFCSFFSYVKKLVQTIRRDRLQKRSRSNLYCFPSQKVNVSMSFHRQETRTTNKKKRRICLMAFTIIENVPFFLLLGQPFFVL